MRFIQFCILILMTMSVVSCAHKPSADTASTNLNGAPPVEEESYPDNPRTLISDDEKKDATIITGLIDNGKLDHAFEKIRINVSQARIKIESTGAKKAGGTIQVKLLKGTPNCKVKLATTETRLTLVEFMPEDLKCRFQIEIAVNKAAELDVNIVRGGVLVTDWKEPLSIESKQADIDIAEVGASSVKCEHCTFSGSGVHGRLKYDIESGNVGVEGLTASVDGKTLGDVVLKWNSVLPGSFVKVVAHSGDVYLNIPKKTQIALDLKVPKGEVFSNFQYEDLVLNSQELKSGMPVSVIAETGNIRITH